MNKAQFEGFLQLLVAAACICGAIYLLLQAIQPTFGVYNVVGKILLTTNGEKFTIDIFPVFVSLGFLVFSIVYLIGGIRLAWLAPNLEMIKLEHKLMLDLEKKQRGFRKL